jgi:hypothetical protein
MKIYKSQKDNHNLLFGNNYGPYFGNGCLGILNDNNRLYSYIDTDPFKVPKNSLGYNEITEEPGSSANAYKDYEVFAISPL